MDFDTQTINLGQTSKKKWPSISEFDAVLLGTWIIIPKLTIGSFLLKRLAKKEEFMSVFVIKDFPSITIKFIKNNEAEFHNKKPNFGLFVSDPWLLLYLVDPIKANEVLEQKIKEQLPFIPDIYESFGPTINLSSSSPLKRDEKESLRVILKIISQNTGIEINYSGFNDFRNWNQIRDFTMKFAKLIKGELIKNKNKICLFCGHKIENPEAKFCNACGTKITE